MAETTGSVPRGPVRWWWHRQLKKPFFGRFMKGWRWPAEVTEDGWQRARIASASGAALAAIWRATTVEPARGVVVCAHPMGLAAKGFWLRQGHAQALLDAGFHVVAYDFNGFGESASTNFDYPADAVAVGAWARRHWTGLPVHARTASFGAQNTVCALGHPEFPYDRVVAEGCSRSLPAFWRRYPFAHAVLQVSRLFAPASERRLRSELQVRNLPGHVRLLLIHSRADRWTPVEHGDRIAAGAPPGARLERLILDRADHTHGLRDEPDAYWNAVRTFLSAP